MPITIDIDKGAGLITTTVRGRLSFEDLRTTLQALLVDPDFDSRFDRLWDLREACGAFLSDEVRANVRAVRELLGGRRAAIVAPRSDAELARIYPLFVEETETQVFHDVDDALEWLQSRGCGR